MHTINASVLIACSFFIAQGCTALDSTSSTAESYTSELCDGQKHILRFTGSESPVASEEVEILPDDAPQETAYGLRITPKCNGQLTIRTHERGLATSKPNGATMRLNINDKEYCRGNDGTKAPDRSDVKWKPETMDFAAYDLHCTPDYYQGVLVPSQLAAGKSIKLQYYRWTHRAEPDVPDDFLFQVEFIRN